MPKQLGHVSGGRRDGDDDDSGSDGDKAFSRYGTVCQKSSCARCRGTTLPKIIMFDPALSVRPVRVTAGGASTVLQPVFFGVDYTLD